MVRTCCLALLLAVPLSLFAQDPEAEAVKILEEKGLVHRQKSKPFAVQTVVLFKADTSDLQGTLLGSFPALDGVIVNNTLIGDATMLELAKCKKLKTLMAKNTRVTDASMKAIGSIKTLQMLDLRGTQVSDEGLKELAKLKVLKNLLVGGSKVTDAGLAELQKALPKCGMNNLPATCE